jgi:hypothetical protein
VRPSNKREISLILASSQRTKMARVRSTVRLTNEGEETVATETAPISEVMKCSGLIVHEEEESVPTKDVTIAKAASDDEEDDDILSPSKPSHNEFGKSTVKTEDLILMKKLV